MPFMGPGIVYANVLFFNNCLKPILFPNEFIDQYNTSNYNYVYHNCVSATIQVE